MTGRRSRKGRIRGVGRGNIEPPLGLLRSSEKFPIPFPKQKNTNMESSPVRPSSVVSKRLGGHLRLQEAFDAPPLDELTARRLLWSKMCAMDVQAGDTPVTPRANNPENKVRRAPCKAVGPTAGLDHRAPPASGPKGQGDRVIREVPLAHCVHVQRHHHYVVR